MTLNMSRAWDDAVAIISANRDVISIVAGVFFFLPYLAFMLLVPNPMMEMASQPGADPDQVIAMLQEFYLSNWWVFLLVSVAQYIGMLGALALLRDDKRPTVGEALKFGLIAFLPFFATQILLGLGMGLILSVPVFIGIITRSIALGVLLGMATLVALMYLAIKFSLAAPIIAIEKNLNPIAVLRRSWELTKGNSLRLLGFYALLMIVFLVISMVLSMVSGLFLALMGAEIALIANGIVSGILNAVWIVLMLGVWAAVHRQLAGETASVAEQFS
ncbi:MAG: hypothetical protein ACK5NN_00715 [Sphingomonadaceae bacterium]